MYKANLVRNIIHQNSHNNIDSRLFGGSNLDTTGGTEKTLDVTVDGELTGSDGTNHEETSTNTGEAALETKLLGDLDQTAGGALTGETLGLVDLGKHGVGGLGDDGSSETSKETSTKVDTSLTTVGEGVLVDNSEDGLRELLESDELGHGVRNLLEEDGTETRVESANTLVLEDLAETAQKTASELRLRDKTNTGSFKGAEGNVGEEFSGSGRGEVDGSTVLGGVLKTELVDPLLLEEFITTELEGTLEEVTGGGRTETGKESASTLVGNDLAETTDHTAVVCSRVKLDSGLDDIDRGESTVGDGAADSTSEGESGVELKPREGSRGGRSVDLRSSVGGHYYGLCDRLCLTQERRKRGRNEMKERWEREEWRRMEEGN